MKEKRKFTLGSERSAVTIDFNVPSYTVKPGTNNDYIYFDLWYSGVANLRFVLRARTASDGPIASGKGLPKIRPTERLSSIMRKPALILIMATVMIQIDFTSTRPPLPAIGN
jgi:hypothetical protein